ncbi:AAA family ATPase, partial [candidate division KSB3 bacterium]|nr:AAA family ATPase [candidate division KSB3 bacterium]MBD3326808.1 AAA family ATPase [candidate division KSB3 bacterium]
HKDLNPSNILWNPQTGVLKLIDFGIATQLAREKPDILHHPDILEGTLAYISPEQTGRMNRSLDYRTDFYSLGVTFYELLVGFLPFQADDPLELMHCHLAKIPPAPHDLNRQIPRPVSEIVMKLLAKTAEDRYQSAKGLLADLQKCADQLEFAGEIHYVAVGQHDVSDTFRLPQKLYGRDAAIHTLLTAVERVRKGPAELILVSGYAGIGKSACVQEISHAVLKQHGYFLTGKFEQFKEHPPYLAVIQALRTLLRHLLTESEARLNTWQDRILRAVESGLPALTEVLPELALLLESPPSSALEGQHRLHSAFLQLIQGIASPDRPLVILLDNLQWADAASLKLVQSLLRSPEIRGLLLIGAYRDQDIEDTHPVHSLLADPALSVQQITLSALSFAEIQQLLADTLQCVKDPLDDLAQIVSEKTAGNPFFIREFLKSLYKEGVLTFDPDNACWQWNPEQIRGMAMTANVVEFMVATIQKLPADTQQMLQYAACIGHRFDLHTLAAVLEKPETDVLAALDRAVHEGLLLPTDDSSQYTPFFNPAELKAFAPHVSYDFAHNRVQEAVLAGIPQARLNGIHLKIGQHLLHCDLHAQLRQEGMAEIVSHFNLARPLLQTDSERLLVARLNLSAANQAKATASYQSALTYVNTGLTLLGADAWENHYALTLELSKAQADIEYLCGQTARAETHLLTILRHTQTDLERAAVSTLLLRQYSLQGRCTHALQTAQKALRLFGMSLPAKHLPKAIEEEWAAIRQRLQNRDIASLIAEPPLTDHDQQMVMQILDTLLPAAFQQDQRLYQWIVLKMVAWSLTHGQTPETADAYARYGVLLGAVHGQYNRGYAFGRLALKISEQVQNSTQQCKTATTLGGELMPWVKPFTAAHEMLRNAYETGVQAGEWQFAGIALMHRLTTMFYDGTNLEQILTDIPGMIEFAQNTHHQAIHEIISGYQLMLHNLCGKTPDSRTFATEHLSEADYLAACREQQNARACCLYQIMKAQVLYLYGHFTEALECAQAAESQIEVVQGSIAQAAHTFYHSLILAALYSSRSREQQHRFWKILTRHQQQMKRWADACPANFQHMYLLIQAEQARLKAQPFVAMQRYRHAIEHANAAQVVQHEALAHELAAQLYLAYDFREFAEIHLTRAYHTYTLWGATRKADALMQHYPTMLKKLAPDAEHADMSPQRHSTRKILNITDNEVSSLDLHTVMKAAQAISGEIRLDELLKQMMTIILENAGAQRGCLILEKDGRWVIEAEGTIDHPDISVLQSIPLNPKGTSQVSRLPVTLIQYVLHTREAVVLSDAAREGNFTHDPAIIKHDVKSVVCTPLMKGGKLMGAIYLDNNLTTGAFTLDRLNVLKILSAQMVISIENATLYNQITTALEYQIELADEQIELTNAYSRFVPREFLRLLEKKSIIDVQLGDHVEKEITVMFADIRGFTHLSEQLTPQENFNFINSYLSQMNQIIREHQGVIDKYIGDAIMALFPTSADDAVKCAIAMLEKLKRYNQGRKRAGYRPIQIGIGLNTGLLMLGTIGDQHRMEGTVIS